MSVICRPAKMEDVPKAVAIRALASSEVREKYGFGSRRKDEAFTPDSFYAFSLKHEPEGFWIAEEAGHVVGMMISWTRDTFQFLAYLFVSPEYQDRKVGKHLLETAFGSSLSPEITNRGLITYAYNTASIGLYMRCGIHAREAIYKMSGMSSMIRAGSRGKLLPEVVRLENSADMFRKLNAIDRKVLGFARGRHHEFFLERSDAEGYLMLKGKDALGYSYIWEDGQVGPLAAVSADAFKGILETSLPIAAARGTEQVSLLVPGSNVRAVTVALQNRLRVREPYILMATKPFGRWGQYLLHSPPLL
jgi:ribosomal protein S18 acetylase RimI-like enzyme